MNKRKMLPEYQRLIKQEEDETGQRGGGGGLKNRYGQFKIKIGHFSLYTVSLPLFAFIFCVAYSLMFYFEQTTSTHCHTWNYLPSISAAIGSFQPQAIVWQLAIVLHFIPRLVVTWMYYKFFQRIVRRNLHQVAYIAIAFNFIENWMLLGLSLYDSSNFYDYHKVFFCTFIVTSEIYMMMSYYLCKHARRDPTMNHIESKSLRLKRNLFIINIVSILLATYFFLRHNDHCEGGIYTLFAFFEYIVVLTNMAFHVTSVYDFHEQHLVFDMSTWDLQIHYQ